MEIKVISLRNSSEILKTQGYLLAKDSRSEELCLNFRRISINRAVEKIAELGTPSLVLLVAMGRIEPFFQSRLLNRFAALAGPLGTFAGFALSAIYRFGSEALFNRVLEELKKQGKTEEQILEEINSSPNPEWLRLRVRGYIENVDFETIESADLSNRNEEIFSIIQQSHWGGF